ncbi:GNAT family N-acetyltransferase [Bordetella genomosp. 1]|uniref:GNAT family N-acetyltransferase n=1 Tax=Bordetella genomosp. 1 TaxID=1395607 RepID=A0ABX4F4D1_9BORD|nr:GNAT family N-acetyltransferase [Bordetella genomosp. 1]OZI68573.1 GNAT family N-acetyltransferase [Bordetella genomosp. 1]
MPTDPRYVHATTDNDLLACHGLMRELRPHLDDADAFLARCRRQQAQDWHLLAVWEDGAPLALAGYRFQENMIYGRFVYVDDLVVSAPQRGAGWGAKLLDEVARIAREYACARLVLDTGLSNSLAQRFYFRRGLLTSAIRFGQDL